MMGRSIICSLTLSLIVLTSFCASCASKGKWPLGMTEGKLAPCPGSPNCVSSEDDTAKSRIEPLAFTCTSGAARACLKRAVQGMGGTIEREDTDYMWAIFKTRVFRFVDDMEFRMDRTNQLIHVRSASRAGYSDLGVNRRRVAALHKLFSQEQTSLANKTIERDKE